MELKAVGTAGTLESSDIMITLEPKDSGGIDLTLESSVLNQYGRQIKAEVLASLERLGVKNAKVIVNDHGALDCTIKARVECAFYRANEFTETEAGEIPSPQNDDVHERSEARTHQGRIHLRSRLNHARP